MLRLCGGEWASPLVGLGGVDSSAHCCRWSWTLVPPPFAAGVALGKSLDDPALGNSSRPPSSGSRRQGPTAGRRRRGPGTR